MKIYLFGYGKMGMRVAALAPSRGHVLVASLEKADVAIDFSVAEAVLEHLQQSIRAHVPLIIGTTGWEAHLVTAQKKVLEREAAALYAPNFSIGIALFRKLLKEARSLLSEYALAGVEYHHEEKRDAPSGTALTLANELNMNPFSSVRCGSIVGKHEVLFDSPVDVLVFTHEAKNRDGFALGALRAAEWILGKKGWFTLDDMLYSADHSLR